MTKEQYIYKVHLHTPVIEGGESDYYFTSMAAIYEVLTIKQVGCAACHLYNLRVSDGYEYRGRRSSVTRLVLHSKYQVNKHSKVIQDARAESELVDT